MKTKTFSIRERIIHILMLKSFSLSDIGLFEGLMGIVISLYEYSRKYKKKVILDYSNYLLDDIVLKISKDMPYSFSQGLSGIGWGLEYLIQKKFIDGLSIEVCEEIDHKIMEVDPIRIVDDSLRNGFEGLLHYILFHIQGCVMQNTKIPFDNIYLSDIYVMCKRKQLKRLNKAMIFLTNNYISFIENKMMDNYIPDILNFVLQQNDIGETELMTYSVGLNSGLAGVLLKIDANEEEN